MKTFAIMILVSFSVIFAGCSTTISGKVINHDNQTALKVKEGKINISYLDGPTKNQSYMVDLENDGTFRIKGDFKEGHYLVEPLIPGYKSESKKIKLAGDKNIILYSLPLKPGKMSVIGTNIDVDVSKGIGGATLTPPKL